MLKSDFQLDWREPGSFMLLFLCVKGGMFLLGLGRLDSFLLLKKKKKKQKNSAALMPTWGPRASGHQLVMANVIWVWLLRLP